ncbi:MAG: exodeoxyribonuclease VII small subunit [Nitrospinota bacterium]
MAARKEREEPLSFEAALSRLEEIVQELEEGDTALEGALALFEEGVKLSRFCSEKLKEAERRVEVLTEEAGGLRARPPEEAGADLEESPD